MSQTLSNKVTGPKTRKNGFTLVELIVAVMVISFGCLAIMRFQITAIRSNVVAENMGLAVILAESEMERVKSLSHEELKNEAKAGSTTLKGLDRNGVICLDLNKCPEHIFSRTVSYYPGLPTSLSTQVEVEVKWSDASGARSVFYSAALTSATF
ncbi:MAG: prepilin-type N-terminal cleavage/methylation domain-containing protein [Deltaproteobacteria bacterium]|jgi:prepilin-type N-terminal cleavage/methylation domain-containing protein|nr:prepilin-type N-terminal cleavage/methylation domain-containing protein [Deltaproteobacteria bacterium]